MNGEKSFITFQIHVLLFVHVLHTKERSEGILALKKVPEHLIWAAECEGKSWEI